MVAVPVFHGPENEGPEPVTGVPIFTPSTLNCTDATVDVVEVAFAVSVIGPRTEAEGTGLVMLTDGGVFATVTMTVADVVVWPCVSVPTADRVWGPLVAVPVNQVVVKFGPEPFTAVPKLAPSNLNCTEAIPMVEVAFACTVSEAETVPPVGLEMLITGGGFDTVTLTLVEVAVWFKLSVTTAVRVCEPFSAVVEGHCAEAVKVAPDAGTAAPRFAPSNLN